MQLHTCSRKAFVVCCVVRFSVGVVASTLHSAVDDNLLFTFYNNVTSWEGARLQCEEKGGHLVTMETDYKWEFIKIEIQKLSNPSNDEWFIGLQKYSDNNWIWITGKPLTNPHWQSSQPSDDGDCVVIAKEYPVGAYGEYNDLNCGTAKKGFICEVQLNSSVSVIKPVYFERWISIRGSNTDDLTSNPRFPNHPNQTGYYQKLQKEIYGPNFGARYRSYLLALETGNYTFYTFCDDTCKLFLSSDISPRNKRLIVDQSSNAPKPPGDLQLSNCCNNDFQVSSPQYLGETKLYYIEVLEKQGAGIDRMYVAMRTPSGAEEKPISANNLRKNITKYDIPGSECDTENDSRFPDYVNCKTFTNSQKIDLALSKMEELQSQLEENTNPSYTFLLTIMKTAGKTASDLLERLNSSSADNDAKESNRGFEVAKAVETLGESIASRLSNSFQAIVVKYPSIVMQAVSGEQNVLFSEATDVQESSPHASLTIRLQNSTQTRTGFFSALYENLDSAIKRNISQVSSGNTTYKEIPHILNSKIISGSTNETFTGQVNFRLENSKLRNSGMRMVCAFWQFTNDSSNTTGHWSTEGCHVNEDLSDDKFTVCHCDHLTHFAILMTVTDDEDVNRPGTPHTKALEIITYVGCALSLVGEALTIITIMCLKLTRAETSIIHLNLVSALAVAQIIFLTGIEATGNKAACKIVAILLHYFNLAAFSWMLVEGVWLYVMIVRVFETGHSRMKKYAACAWGIPLVFVIITLSASFDGYGTDRSCWLSVQKGTIWSFVVPVLLIALANSIILGMVVKEILRLSHPASGDMTKYQSARSGVKSAVVLLPLLGITWLFGVLTFNSDTLAFQYLFAIFNSLQGFFIFLFHCLLNSEVRRAFNRKKKIWSETHDLFQTNSVSPPNYNDISKDTLSTRHGSVVPRPGSAVSAISNLSQVQ